MVAAAKLLLAFGLLMTLTLLLADRIAQRREKRWLEEHSLKDRPRK